MGVSNIFVAFAVQPLLPSATRGLWCRNNSKYYLMTPMKTVCSNCTMAWARRWFLWARAGTRCMSSMLEVSLDEALRLLPTAYDPLRWVGSVGSMAGPVVTFKNFNFPFSTMRVTLAYDQSYAKLRFQTTPYDCNYDQ
ncbi:hypothetical protein SK128_008551 [Halocaridina rubra]|uniref:Uncharacterized protein n=1 Tax=Halocaridina rubra TaxID=373956 RepID=A0AAN8XFL0_HALRR